MSVPDAQTTTLPADYHARIFEVEERHWWHRGMRQLSRALLGDRLRRPGQRLLDAGCGTGGFMRWLLEQGAFAEASGVDVSPEAVDLARTRVPSADLRVAPVAELPFADRSFDLVVMNDVLQHIPEPDVARSLRAVRRVLAPDGTLLVRTGAARSPIAERVDWRTYDRAALADTLAGARLETKRITHANMLPSLVAAARGGAPRAPTEASHGIPVTDTRLKAAVGGLSLALEAGVVARTGWNVPYGHTLLGLALPREGP